MRPLLALFLLHLLASQPAHAGEDPFSVDALRRDVTTLAADNMEGRMAGSPASARAAQFIASRFKEIGLVAPSGAPSYFQEFTMLDSTLGKNNALTVAISGKTKPPLRLSEEYYPLGFAASGHARGELVFAGFGVVNPALSYDDYSGGDVKGKFVLILLHEPGELDPASPFNGVSPTEAASDWRRVLYAQERGAIGVLFVRDVVNHPEGYNFQEYSKRHWEVHELHAYRLASQVERIRIPAAVISPAVAEELLSRTGRTLADLSTAAETVKGFTPVAVPGVTIDLTTSIDRHAISDRNVLGIINGKDPKLAGEVLIIGAHFDHDGLRGDKILNGANDNASAVAGLLAIATAYAQSTSGDGPRRTILFAAWGAEEHGCLGSWAYTENPLYPLKDTAAVVNFEMLGRSEEIPVVAFIGIFKNFPVQTAQSNANAINILGHSFSDDMRTAVEHAAKGSGLEIKFRYDNSISNIGTRMDSWPFLYSSIPAISFFGGSNPTYHQPTDRPETIEYDKMSRIVRLAHGLVRTLEQQEGRPRFDGWRAGREPEVVPNAYRYINLSLMYARRGEYAKCIDASLGAITLEPTQSSAYNNLCYCHLMMKSYDEAIAACQQALVIDPSHVLAANNLEEAQRGKDKQPNFLPYKFISWFRSKFF